VGGEQLRELVRELATFSHVGIVEGDDIAQHRQSMAPALHPGMRRRDTGTMGEQQDGSIHADTPS
jgi:hypothetical protein